MYIYIHTYIHIYKYMAKLSMVTIELAIEIIDLLIY